jgi:outer membrane protein OmpA-like peptidoglycan-associated protein
MTGCQHVSRSTHYVPEERNYKQLDEACPKEAQAKVDEAHRVGAQHYAPYEYFSAEAHAAMAKEEHWEGDKRGARDYAKISQEFAAAAIEKSGIPDAGPMPRPADREACWDEYRRLKGRFEGLSRCKAILVAPVLYAHVESSLSYAEHELNEWGHWPEAADFLMPVEADIDTILSQDVDADGIKDMEDGDPWIPEDMDGCEDGDGIPEPKPYPVLDNIMFSSGSAALSAEAKGYLRGIAHMMDRGYVETKICVDGHTDSIASDDYNVDLSERRATAVGEYLMKFGVASDRVVSAHHGESMPIADNGTAEGKAKNRRVELKLDSPDVVSKYCQ